MLSTELEASVTKALPPRMQPLTAHLKELKIVINFLSALPNIEEDSSLKEYIDATFGRGPPEYLSKEIKLKHVKHVWLIVKYAQTDLFMRNKQVQIL